MDSATNGNGYAYEYKNVYYTGSGYRARVQFNGQRIHLPIFRVEAEAALAYNYAASLLWEGVVLNEIPAVELPEVDRQWEIYDLVVDKLIKSGVLAAM